MYSNVCNQAQDFILPPHQLLLETALHLANGVHSVKELQSDRGLPSALVSNGVLILGTCWVRNLRSARTRAWKEATIQNTRVAAHRQQGCGVRGFHANTPVEFKRCSRCSTVRVAWQIKFCERRTRKRL